MVETIEYPLVSPDEIAGQAWAATARHDADEALRLWQSLRQDFPDRPDGYIWPIQLLWQGGRLEDADAMAAAAFARFPEHPDLMVQFAWIAMVRQRWDEALQWWEQVRAARPERLDGYVWAARALWQATRFEEADAMAAEAVRRFPDEALALAESAWVAVNRRDWPAARERWQRLLEHEPERLDAQRGLIQALRMSGQVDEAERLAGEAVARHPDNLDFIIERIWTAVARDDWPAAGSRLAAARQRLQEAGRFDAMLGGVEYRVRMHMAEGEAAAPAEPAAAPAIVTPEADEDLSPSDLMLAFESLGERCDFGAVQRHFGVEPLGLLRFAFSKFDALIAALEDRFDAVGTEEDTAFNLWQDETIIYMRKYGLIFHTFVYEGELTTSERREAFYRQQRRRLSFLKNKLVSDLSDPQKIYVYSSDERTADADVARLFRALRAHGPNSLLYVRPAMPGHPEGTVEQLEDGLYAGYYAGLADFLGGAQPPFELWRQLCERTYRLAQASAARSGVALKDLL